MFLPSPTNATVLLTLAENGMSSIQLNVTQEMLEQILGSSTKLASKNALLNHIENILLLLVWAGFLAIVFLIVYIARDIWAGKIYVKLTFETARVTSVTCNHPVPPGKDAPKPLLTYYRPSDEELKAASIANEEAEEKARKNEEEKAGKNN